MNVLLVEDDFKEANSIENELRKNFPVAKFERINTESMFRARFDSIADDPPDLIVLDIALTWTDPSPHMEPRPEDVQKEGIKRAGLRCMKMLIEDQRTSQVPILLCSFLNWINQSDQLTSLPPNVFFMEKTPDIRSFISLARSLLNDKVSPPTSLHNIFIVHGRDEGAKEAVARFVERLGLNAIVLHEQASAGSTIIEKFEEYSDVVFAVVLLTPDDVGQPRDKSEKLKPRARQNVIFELGYFVAKIGRKNVCVLYKEVEIPSDFQSIVYVPMDPSGAWRGQLAKEMKKVGLPIDLNRAWME
jgi:predicted nucleotide-binding protein